MTIEEKALMYFKDLRERKIKYYSAVFSTALKDFVVYEAVLEEIEIYDTVIKALEQEPCEDDEITEDVLEAIKNANSTLEEVKNLLKIETCEDVVSRSEIINRLKGFERLHNEDELRTNLIDMIWNLPPVSSPQPKTGHWKHNKCDVCGASRPPLFDNYCPNCGAGMAESED